MVQICVLLFGKGSIDTMYRMWVPKIGIVGEIGVIIFFILNLTKKSYLEKKGPLTVPELMKSALGPVNF